MPEYFNTTSTLFGQPPESATDHEATLREGLAVTIYESLADKPIPDDMPMAGFMVGWGPVADAALRHLTEAGALIPPLPEGWVLFEAEVRTPGEVAVLIQGPPWVFPDDESPDDEPTEYVGTGSTLAAAIAAAIGEPTP